MATTNGNRKILDMKRWEFCTPAPAAAAAGCCIGSSRHYKQQQLYLASSTAAFLYNPSEDGFVQVPSPALAGTFGGGTAITAASWSTGATAGVAFLTATAGTTSTITTNQTLTRDLRGYSVHILSGPNAGVTATIASNTIGANSVITFTSSYGSAFNNTTTYRLLTPRWYVVNAGTLAANIFKAYDYATNTWIALSQTGLPATIGTDSKLVTTPGWMDNGYLSFSTGTATGATSTTLADSTKGWGTNQWVNSQVRIVSGTGAGQIRSIISNGSTLTVSPWTITPDTTSTYSIEGNDDYIYYMGSALVTLYRYSISANTWSTITPSVARGGATGAGLSGHWVYGVTDPAWTAENSIQNGRYIYSFRGGNQALLDRYDIAANAWSAVTYSPATELFTTGSKYAYSGNYLYMQKDATGRWFRFTFATSELDGWNTMLYPNGTAVAGDTAFDVTYTDGGTEITYVYMVLNSLNIMLRQMVV